MRTRPVVAALSISLGALLLIGCPSSSPKKRTTPPPPPERVISAFRVADRMPSDVTYAALARSLSVLVDGVRSALRPLRVLDRSLTPDQIDSMLRRSFGWNPLDLGELDDAGFDVDASVGLYSTGIEPTVLLPIKSVERLTKFLGVRTKRVKMFIRRVKGRTHNAMVLDSHTRLSWVVVDGYLALHISMRPPSQSGDFKPDPSWLDAVVDKRPRARSLSASKALAWVLQGADKRRDVALYYQPPGVSAAAKPFAAKAPPECDSHRRELEQLSRVGAVALFKKGHVDVALRADLGKDAAAALAKMTDGAPALPASIWDKAPLRLQVAFNPDVVAQLARRIGNRRCGPSFELLRELRYLPALYGPMPALRYSHGRMAAALLAADERGQGTLHIEGAALVAPSDSAAAKRITASLPMTQKSETIASKQVKQLSPTIAVAQTMRAFVGAKLVALTSGEGLMEKLLGGAASGKAAAAGKSTGPHSLLSFLARPSGLADLRAPLKLLERPKSAHSARYRRYRHYRRYRYGRYAPLDALAHLLSSYKSLAIDVGVDPAAGELRASLRYTMR